MDLSALPGGEIVERGLRDLAEGKETAESLLVLVGGTRLRALGVPVPAESGGTPPEHRLYDLLARGDPASAHSRYNALIRKLVRFERAAECVPA